jgi:hypothetical protein
MTDFKGYINKRVVLLIDARAYDALNYSDHASNSLVLIADVYSEDNQSVFVKNIEVRSNGLFYSKKWEMGEIKINGGGLDKRFIIGVFDDFEEVSK